MIYLRSWKSVSPWQFSSEWETRLKKKKDQLYNWRCNKWRSNLSIRELISSMPVDLVESIFKRYLTTSLSVIDGIEKIALSSFRDLTKILGSEVSNSMLGNIFLSLSVIVKKWKFKCFSHFFIQIYNIMPIDSQAMNWLLFIDTDERLNGPPNSLRIVLVMFQAGFEELGLSHVAWRGQLDGWLDDLYLNTIRILKLQACGVVYK